MAIVETSTLITKRSGEKVEFHAYKVELILDLLGVDEDVRQAVMADVHRVSSQPYLNTAMIYEAVLLQLETVAPEAAHEYQEVHAINEKIWARAIDPETKLGSLVNSDDKTMHENANKDSRVFNTFRDLMAGMVGKSMGLKLLPETVAKAHLRGDLHWHDLDYTPLGPMSNCCLVDFKHMFANGYVMGNAQVEPPKSIGTATAQMAQIIANVASSQYGGTSVNAVDELLAPYAALNYQKHLQMAKKFVTPEKQVAYATEQTKKDIYNAMQALEYEINTLASAQGQTPFTTLGFGLGTNWIEREIQKAIFDIRIAGIGPDHRTAIFPKLVFSLKRGVNMTPDDPNYDIKKLAITCSAKRMYPDVLNYEKIVELTGSFKAPMGCRSFLQGWRDENGVEVNEGRMNLGVVTLNIPRIAIQARDDRNLFWQILEERLELAKKALKFKLARTKEAMPENAPILYKNGVFGKNLTDGDDVDILFRDGRATLSLGYIGLYEVGTHFFGPDWEQNSAAHDFTVAIVKRLNEACKAWEAEDGYHYSVYSTPAESLTDRFCELDKVRFGLIADITDKEYYTNSFHYDVRKHPNPFEKLTFEEAYPKYASGGFIHYCEYPNLKQNPAALEAVWDFAYDHVGYLGTNTPIDKCFKCGFEGDFQPTARGFRCPECGNRDPQTCDVVKRTCGYLGNPQARPMIHGRHVEIASRVKHMSQTEVNQEDVNETFEWHYSAGEAGMAD
ncbi:anaerobic ribonucleoside-triphosphate reductase [Weissella diestrammenae]|uniref:Anaerobic ribonucleoside-triphosphate reductase n=1 Tax=Weissella diestrammenae TaxID=1162633 RepID=A0A7G9T5S3_9LACO|nr:anaerobic ribonucleoside-triphosphate reductase [Weissella diestrammenae]MCM0582276.1 anaerobic ribonucleoside-triphosphate reductase [Weissella diestrammenae]QNN75448.1 anaerobic ribonucleoside-triphosphate reductase [Weissella diestrammenae]